jgi:hypothetical protein
MNAVLLEASSRYVKLYLGLIVRLNAYPKMGRKSENHKSSLL